MVGERVERGRLPGTSAAGCSPSSQNICARVPRQKPSSGMTGEDCSQPPDGVAETMLPSRSMMSKCTVSPATAASGSCWTIRPTVGKSELGGLDEEVDELGPGRVFPLKAELRQDRQLLQRHQPLRPWSAFLHAVMAIIIMDRILDARLPAGHVGGAQDAAMAPAGDV